jgi:hypothetical protein
MEENTIIEAFVRFRFSSGAITNSDEGTYIHCGTLYICICTLWGERSNIGCLQTAKRLGPQIENPTNLYS